MLFKRNVHRCTQGRGGEGERGEGERERGRVRFEKFVHRNAIKQEPDFLTPQVPSK
jgi:hypothetical protein